MPVVPQAKRVHTAQSLYKAIDSPVAVAVNKDLGIRVAFERMALVFELGTKLTKVVQGPVEDDSDAPVGAQHGLLTGVGHIEDRESTVTKDRAPPTFEALTIRP